MKGNEMKQFGYTVYIHRSPDGRVYVGATSAINPETRWGPGGKWYHYNIRFSEAIAAYGWDNFEHIIVSSNLNRQEALTLEQSLIIQFDATNPDKGYNIVVKGGTSCISPEGRERIRQALILRRGHKWTDEQRRRFSAARKGVKLRPCSESTKQKISIANKGRSNMTELQRQHIIAARKAHPHTFSEETRKKMSDYMRVKYSDPLIRQQLSDRMKGKSYLTAEGRNRLINRFTLYTVDQIDSETNSILATFESFREAATYCIESGFTQLNLDSVRNKLYDAVRLNKMAFGYTWVRHSK